jgi:hypothetical protein
MESIFERINTNNFNLTFTDEYQIHLNGYIDSIGIV